MYNHQLKHPRPLNPADSLLDAQFCFLNALEETSLPTTHRINPSPGRSTCITATLPVHTTGTGGEKKGCRSEEGEQRE